MASCATPTIFTIGHATRTSAAFIALLQEAGIERLVDVRTVPRSRTNPQFNREILPRTLNEVGIAYTHLAPLGGLRGRSHPPGASPNTLWRNDSFRNYADYAMGPAFHAGLERLRELAGEGRCAVMCAEAVWWRCHRRIIADYLIAGGIPVMHIMAPRRVEPARLTPGARLLPDGALLYRAPAAPE
ncbi:MAG: DUF488 domain-containing protein [Alphaproteobacteria bacterium]|nr:DUF488 domain-containing protein [Alphaproteobacteria bacterium]